MKTKKWVVPASRPRNPLVAAAHARHAGSHRPSNKALRAKNKRQARREMHADLAQLRRSARNKAGEYVWVFLRIKLTPIRLLSWLRWASLRFD